MRPTATGTPPPTAARTTDNNWLSADTAPNVRESELTMAKNVTDGLGRGGTDFRPPPRPGDQKRARRARTGLVVLAVLVVVAVGVTAYHFAARRTPGPPASPLALCRGSTPRFQIFKNNGACVGVTDGSYVFNPSLAPIERAIASENASVREQRTYATVALLTPMTASPASDVSLARIKDELAGAYAAQLAANGGDLSQDRPPIQLVLANEGTSQELAYGQVTGLLTEMRAPPTNLRAVIGMGVSVEQTVLGAKILGKAGIPMVGSVTTADQLDWPNITGLARVVPDVSDQVTALQRYFAGHGGLGPAVLVADTNTGDLYTSDLMKDFTAAFGQDLSSQPQPFGPGRGEGTELRLISSSVCPLTGTPPTVLYAGRESALPTLISNLQGAPNCGGKQITVVTGSDAVALAPSLTTNQSREGHISVIYSDIENPNPGAVLPQVQKIFAGSQAGTASLTDPWTIATYNAMTAASIAITDAASGSSPVPLLGTVLGVIPLLNQRQEVPGADGPFSIGPDGNLINPDVPILKLTDGSVTLLSS
jgi:hypothetical protein